LLACASIPLEELLHYPMIRWCPQACEALSRQVEALIGHLDAAFTATTFELMTVLVAAGYGIGLAPRERVAQARPWGIVMRPLAEGPHWIGTNLFRPTCRTAPAIERFARRAEQIAARGDASRSFP
jgi:DNA-binding transcriptional LysR family regulator